MTPTPGHGARLRRLRRGMLSKALELWAFRVATLCKSIQAKARPRGSPGPRVDLGGPRGSRAQGERSDVLNGEDEDLWLSIDNNQPLGSVVDDDDCSYCNDA